MTMWGRTSTYFKEHMVPALQLHIWLCFVNDGKMVRQSGKDCWDYRKAIWQALTTTPYTESLSKPQRKPQTFRLLSYGHEIISVARSGTSGKDLQSKSPIPRKSVNNLIKTGVFKRCLISFQKDFPTKSWLLEYTITQKPLFVNLVCYNVLFWSYFTRDC